MVANYLSDFSRHDPIHDFQQPSLRREDGNNRSPLAAQAKQVKNRNRDGRQFTWGRHSSDPSLAPSGLGYIFPYRVCSRRRLGPEPVTAWSSPGRLMAGEHARRGEQVLHVSRPGIELRTGTPLAHQCRTTSLDGTKVGFN